MLFVRRAAKLNVLHLHLSDMQSFPVQVKKYPKLWSAAYSTVEVVVRSTGTNDTWLARQEWLPFRLSFTTTTVRVASRTAELPQQHHQQKRPSVSHRTASVPPRQPSSERARALAVRHRRALAVRHRRHLRASSPRPSVERYRQRELADLVAYASARGVAIVPEFDTPGHSKSMCDGAPAGACMASLTCAVFFGHARPSGWRPVPTLGRR